MPVVDRQPSNCVARVALGVMFWASAGRTDACHGAGASGMFWASAAYSIEIMNVQTHVTVLVCLLAWFFGPGAVVVSRGCAACRGVCL